MTCPTCQKDAMLADRFTWKWEVEATKEIVTFELKCDHTLCIECLKKFAMAFLETFKAK